MDSTTLDPNPGQDAQGAAPASVPRPASLPHGVGVIERALATMPQSPGVYRMLDGRGDALYVGKARSLKKRVVNYTQVARLPERLRRMVAETISMEIVTTHTEAEALLLEANLIKRLKPRFNIVLRDDKSYPWLMLTEDHAFPQITKHRGSRSRKGSYYGPFASAWAVNQTVTAMQRVFLLRSCQDTVFSNRSRPCLLFQIKRCSAPCVGKVSAAEYGHLVDQARAFLSGKASTVQQELAAEMERAAEGLEYERAAAVRDRIRGLTHVQGTAVINPASLADADVIAAHQIGGQTCVQVFFIRGGRNNGNRAFFPTHTKEAETAQVLAAFLAQFYDDKPPPPVILLNEALEEQALLAEALSLKAARRVELSVPARGEKRAVVLHAETNAREALERRMAETAGQAKLLEGVAEVFGLAGVPGRIEVLRQQPHHGDERVWGDGGGRAGGVHEAGVSEIRDPWADRAGGRFRDDAGGSGAAVRAGVEGAGGGGCGGGCGAGDPGFAVDRRGGRAVERGAGDHAGFGAAPDSGGGDCEGAGPGCRAGVVPHGWAGAVPAADAGPGAVLPAAGAGRDAPVRDHDAPGGAEQGAGDVGAGRGAGGGLGAEAGVVEPFRVCAGGEAGGVGGSGERAGDQPGDGAAGLCAFSCGVRGLRGVAVWVGLWRVCAQCRTFIRATRIPERGHCRQQHL